MLRWLWRVYFPVTSRMWWRVWMPFITPERSCRSTRCRISETNSVWLWWDTEGDARNHCFQNGVLRKADLWPFSPSWSPRIRISKQLDVEPEEPASLELEAEGEPPKAARRKQKRSRKDPASPAEAMEEKVREAELVVEALPLPSILMVEVDNVIHEDFQVTEEVKVSFTLLRDAISANTDNSLYLKVNNR